MIPAIVGREVRRTIEDYLRTSYRISTPSLYRALDEFIQRGDAFKGTYLSLHLPFEKSRLTEEPFPHIPLNYTPYLHQERAFERLTADPPKPTIVATGTGSGKTEAFLLPILDYCRRAAGQSGIRAILIYPMNALATDQAKRIAKIIYQTPSLRGNITAGLYIGDSEKASKRMTESSVITDRYTLRDSPPDLLLTNYKMLDYLMVRPKDKPLWQKNRPDTLRFLVVDELHTFDGAQGTDLACLLRRLKSRLGADQLCPIGTSATLGSGSTDELRHYASQIFDAEFDEESIITEERRDAGTFLMETLSSRFTIPSEITPPDQFDSMEEYIQSQCKSWFGQDTSLDEVRQNSWRIKLGAVLREHVVFENMIKILRRHNSPLTSDISEDLFKSVASKNGPSASALLESFLSLISYALALTHDSDETPIPLLDVRIQLWMRELKRMVVSVCDTPKMVWSADLGHQDSPHYLPIASCIKCGAAGWVSAQEVEGEPLSTDLNKIYQTFFYDKSGLILKIIYPDPDPDSVDHSDIWKLCTHCLQVLPQRSVTCNECQQGNSLMNVYIPTLKFTNKKCECPHCGERNQPAIFGAQGSGLLSAALGKVFSSIYNQDKKVLAFSDSVQDAAHRAGYFESRTYTFSIRTALTQYIKSHKEPQNIQAITDGLIKFQRDQLGDANFVGTFIAPNMTWKDDYQTLVKTGNLPKNSHLPSKVANRLQWEIFDNLGLRAQWGRTLEKTLSAAVSTDDNLLSEWISQVLLDLRAEYAGLEELSEFELKQFITGLIYRLRTSGGIMHPRLKEYINSLGKKNFTLSERHIDWMPRYNSNRPRHQFLSSGGAKNFLPIVGTKVNSWVQSWANQCLFKDKIISRDNEVLLQIMEHAPTDLLQPTTAKDIRIWGIKPSSLIVTTKVSPFTCKACSSRVTVPKQDEKIWQKMPCLMHKCTGSLEKDTDRESEIDYYRELYGSGDVLRFVPKEHTGLLTSKQRETIELNFMRKQQRPWDPNIVSSTPTLELGIDIGDLSTVFLCSIPPSQSNYLQRIGRSGRKNGNSFCFSMATSKSHDQYFFAEPDQMIAGDVTAPGVFLRAPGVLQRQMAAFSMDRWIMHSKHANVPTKLRIVLGALDRDANDVFPWNWLTYVETHADQLAMDFYGMFQDQDNQEILERANHFYSADDSQYPQLRATVLEELFVKHEMRKDLKNRINRIERLIADLKEAPKDENFENDLRQLQSYRRGLKGMRWKIGDSDVFNYLSDAGILPNYSFPQSSVTLNSTILSGRDREQKKNLSESFDRPGYAAIREFAPGNYFYANGKKVRIDGIQVSKDHLKVWRFCPDCSWHELESDQTSDRCPACGSDDWNEIGQTLQMVRLSEVKSTSYERKSRIDDSRDERHKEEFEIKTHVKFNDQDIQTAYQSSTEGISFGFEFIQKCHFTYINHGLKFSDAPRKMRVSGQETRISSFNICTECGKAKIPDRKNGFDHECYCKYRGKENSPRALLSLYHDFESEAIRILLPVAETDLDTVYSESFSAALLMGLKECFHGQVDHLQTIIQDGPIPNEQIRRSFIYLYDTVPGGTGHLQGLLGETPMIEKVLRPALQKLQDCPCQEDPSKDGCYQCLYAYRNSFTQGSISRKEAIHILQQIVEKGTQLEKIRSIEDIDIHPLVDSKLEELFIKNLSQWKEATVTTLYQGSEKYYQLTVADHIWKIECQVLLNRTHGVSISSKPDFLLIPESHSDSLPVAVFMDGFTYHRDQLADDTLKRMAILRSTRYLVWSLTWDDLQIENRKDLDAFPLFPKKFAPHLQKFIRHFDGKFDDFSVQEKVQNAGSFEILKGYLTDPSPKKWQALSYCHAILTINQPSSKELLQSPAPQWYYEDFFSRPDSKTSVFWISDQDQLHSGCLAVNLIHNGTTDPTMLRSFIYLDDTAQSEPSFKPVWNGFLRAMNLFQFLHPHTGFFCASALGDPEYYDGLMQEMPIQTIPTEWIYALEESEGHHRLLGTLMDHNAPAPDVGFEILNAQNITITTAELAWPQKKVAVLHCECWDDHTECERENWTCYKMEDITESHVDEILALLNS